MVTSDRIRWFALGLLCAVQFMLVLNVVSVNVALPSIQTDLGFSQENLQWVISGYALVFGGLLLLGGRLADIVGRRGVFTGGLVVFTVGSLSSGLAWSDDSLIAEPVASEPALGRRRSSPFRPTRERRSLMQTHRKIAVAGATGRVGRHLVEVLEAAGHDVVPMSRSTGVNVVTGEGLAEALAGVDRVVDAATPPTPDQKAATEFFTASARNLQEVGARTGVQRIVVVSIIGIDRFTTGYNAAKVAQEQAIQSGPIPVRILRAAQFHEFAAQRVEWGRQGDVIYVPPMRTQLVAARTVAEGLADLANGSTPAPETSAATISEVAGPREETLVEVARLLAARRGDSVRIEGVNDPADPEHALYASGALLPGPEAVLAGPTFEQWLGVEA